MNSMKMYVYLLFVDKKLSFIFILKTSLSIALFAICFSKHNDEFNKLGYKVIGVSKDTVASHSRFILKQNLNFMLLSDPTRQVLETYGVVKEKTMYGKKVKGTRRTTFIINEEGLISDIFYDVDPKTSTKELLAYLSSNK